MSENSKIEELTLTLARTRIQLQQAIDEKDGAQYELKSWQKPSGPPVNLQMSNL